MSKPRVLTALEKAMSIPHRLDDLEREVDGLRASAEFVGSELCANEIRHAENAERLSRIEAMLGMWIAPLKETDA